MSARTVLPRPQCCCHQSWNTAGMDGEREGGGEVSGWRGKKDGGGRGGSRVGVLSCCILPMKINGRALKELQQKKK